MGETLTQQRRVSEEGPWVVKLCQLGRSYNCPIGSCIDGTSGQAPANSVPAAAVTRGAQALFGIIGRKGRVGGLVGQM